MPARTSFANKLRVAGCLLGVWLSVGAQAQQIAGAITLRDMLTRYMTMLDGQCPASAAQIEAARKKGEVKEARLLGLFHQMFCVCHPAKARGLLENLTAAQLAKLVETREAFDAVAVPAIMEPCHGEQMREMFRGEDCLGFISTDVKPGTVARSYCGCMRTEIAAFTDHDIGTYLKEITDTMPALRAAKAAKKPLPEKSKLLSRYVGALDKCGGGQEFLPAP